MVYSRRGLALSAMAFFLLFIATTARADESDPLDCLVLNEGDSLRLNIDNGKKASLLIKDGIAKRVPRKPHIPFDIDKRIIELDIDTRALSVNTNALQIMLSGPKEANVSGVDAENWGSMELPALYLDRDCAIVINGKADSSAVIRVNPLAMVTIDARNFKTPEIKIVGNFETGVLAMKETKISFFKDNVARRSVVSNVWFGGSSTAPAVPSAAAPAPPASTTPSAPAAPASTPQAPAAPPAAPAGGGTAAGG
ncbi:MAG: hypothetical protein LBQ19_04670, partial [Synergistaceae bacterium]|nr:hypothetical protein [Synergistaceae bacterium]